MYKMQYGISLLKLLATEALQSEEWLEFRGAVQTKLQEIWGSMGTGVAIKSFFLSKINKCKD